MIDLDEKWRDEAECRNHDPNLWFPVEYDQIAARDAKRICNNICPVRAECLAFALEHHIDHGIWGGMAERGRARYRRRKARAA